MGLFDLGVELPPVDYEYVTSNDRAKEVLSSGLGKSGCIEVDTEGTGLDPWTAKTTLLQLGADDRVYVFDVRNDMPHCDVDPDIFKHVLCDDSIEKIFQNAVYDMKMMKTNFGYYPTHIYDTMLAEQLLYLGVKRRGFALHNLVDKYIGLTMDKEPRGTFSDYGQKYTERQLRYAATDVVVLELIKSMQQGSIKKHGLEEVCRLEFEFTKPLAEMELNGIKLDKDRWNKLLEEEGIRNKKEKNIVLSLLKKWDKQTTLFGVPDVNIDSNTQLLSILRDRMGLNISDTSEKSLSKWISHPVVEHLLEYRSTNKMLSTYGPALVNKIHEVTGRLHTEFTQMVSTGRMSSKKPNLQNIPGIPVYRSCFIAEEGHDLVTADMAGAELRILGNMSEDPIFIECYSKGIDLHTRAASEVFGVSYEEVEANKKKYRTPVKSIQFGLCVSEGTMVYTSDGIKTIEDVSIGDSIAHDCNIDRVCDYKYMGKKEVYTIKTKYGYTLELTGEHSLRVIDEHGNYVDKEVRNINIDKDHICIKYGSMLFPYEEYVFPNFICDKNTNYKEFQLPEVLTADWAGFLGLFVSEGGVTKKEGGAYNQVCFNFSLKIPEFISKIDDMFSYTVKDRMSKKFYCDIYNGSVYKYVRYCLSSIEFTGWLLSILGIDIDSKTDNIRIPMCVKRSPKYVQVEFLRWLFEGDGTVKKNGNGYRIGYSTKSYYLIHDLQIMLLNFGIMSSIRIERRKDYPGEKYYELALVGSFSRDTFIDSIGFVTDYKNNKCVSVTKRDESVYTIPYQESRLIRILKDTQGNRNGRSLYDTVYNCIKYNEYKGIGNSILHRFTAYDDFLLFMHENNIVPLSVESINKTGVKDVYDISVENRELFLANGIVSHNCYGLSKFGLSARLNVTEDEAQNLINNYFSKYKKVKAYLDKCAYDGVRNKHSVSIAGRKRFYNIPPYGHDEYNKIVNSVKRQAMNLPIQSSNADTIKQSMIYIVDRLEKSGYDARLILTVHDEVVIETKHEQRYEVAELVSSSIIDGFGRYFKKIPMETDALIGPCWLKDGCNAKGCGCTEMVYVDNEIVCKECRKELC